MFYQIKSLTHRYSTYCYLKTLQELTLIICNKFVTCNKKNGKQLQVSCKATNKHDIMNGGPFQDYKTKLQGKNRRHCYI